METFEATVQVTFIVEAEDEFDAVSQIENTLQEVALDWGSIRIG